MTIISHEHMGDKYNDYYFFLWTPGSEAYHDY